MFNLKKEKIFIASGEVHKNWNLMGGRKLACKARIFQQHLFGM
jgi:hypothetical protein